MTDFLFLWFFETNIIMKPETLGHKPGLLPPTSSFQNKLGLAGFAILFCDTINYLQYNFLKNNFKEN